MTEDLKGRGITAPRTVSRLDLGDAGPYAIAFAPNGDLWVTLVDHGEILRRSPGGTETRFAVGERPGQLGVTSEATWCAVTGENRIAMITGEGGVRYLDAPGAPYGLALAGTNVWVTLMEGNAIAAGGIGGFGDPVPMPVAGSFPAMVTVDEGGSVWVSLNQAGALARRASEGDVELIELPEGAAPVGIAAGGGYVWAADIARGVILRVDRDRRVREFALQPDSRPHAVVAVGAGCWFTEWGANRLGRITEDERLMEFDLSEEGDEPHGLAVDRDGSVWVAFESGAVVAFAQPVDAV